MSQNLSDQVFTAAELARAAGVPLHDVETCLAAGEIRTVRGTAFIATAEAVRAGRLLRVAAASRPQPAISLFAVAAGARASVVERRGGLPAVVSSAFHAALIAVAFWFSAGTDTAAVVETETEPARLVFIMSPGIGGGGGGGGLKNPLPPPKVKRIGLQTRNGLGAGSGAASATTNSTAGNAASSARAAAGTAHRRASRDSQGGSG